MYVLLFRLLYLKNRIVALSASFRIVGKRVQTMEDEHN